MSESTRKAFEKWISSLPAAVQGTPSRWIESSQHGTKGDYISESIQLAWTAWQEAMSRPCITLITRSGDGAMASCVYLRDGMKISVGRGIRSTGSFWLEINQQSAISIN